MFQKYEPVIHKNTPMTNARIAKVKHLVKVIPITFPNGLPEDESDLHHCILRPDGALEIKKRLSPVEEKLTSEEDQLKELWTMDDATVAKATRKVMDHFTLSQEYFPAKYVYKYNQDGKEHRYHGDHNIGANRSDWH